MTWRTKDEHEIATSSDSLHINRKIDVKELESDEYEEQSLRLSSLVGGVLTTCSKTYLCHKNVNRRVK